MHTIKFGTDGWRAIIALDYTVYNVQRVSVAAAKWMVDRDMSKVVIGYDCRFGSQMFAEAAASVFGYYNIEVLLSDKFVSTPMVSLGVIKEKADLGVVITASHNPPSYNGYKLKSKYGGPSIPSEIAEIEGAIPGSVPEGLPTPEELKKANLLTEIDLEDIYARHVEENFDLDLIRGSNIKMAYDAMYGAGQDIVKRLLPDSEFLHCEFNPSFNGQAPEPIDRNLGELSKLVAERDDIDMGLANDGDADRIGLYDENGQFVDSHHILLLLLYYLYEYKEFRDGKVVVTFSVTDKMKMLADHYGLDFEVTKIGFKYIAEIMRHTKVLVGGEESGGLTVAGHIPERDGIWVGLLVMEFMARTGKKMSQLIEEVYELVGPFAFDRYDLHIAQEKKQQVMQNCADNKYASFGKYEVEKVENIDGYKFFLGNNSWVMIRPSGTEPLLRVYCQAPDMEEVIRILDTVKESL